MKKSLNVIFSLILIFALVMPASFTPASAATYRTAANSVSSSYKGSKYYTNFTKVKLTGDGRTDVVALAMSQAGYLESNSAGSYAGTTAGSGNYTEYNYNMGNWGSGYAYEWCATFCSWAIYQAQCTNQGSISDWCRNHKYTNSAYIWREVGCAHWADQLRHYGYFKYSKHNGGTYAPQPGDLIFYDWAGGKSGEDHIGIVVYSDSSYVYTIEGNTSDAQGLVSAGGGVFFKKYSLGYGYITGYGVLPYKSVSSVEKIDYSGAKPTPGYYVNTNGTKALYSTQTGTSTLVTVPRHTMFEVTEICSNGRLKATVTVNGTSYTGYMLNDSNRVVQFTGSGKTVSAPSISVNSTVNSNQSLSVSWGAVNNATSYKYSVQLYNGEPSATAATTVLSSTTTGTSFTVPAQGKGKYMKITVTAVGPNNTADAAKTVLVDSPTAYPADVEYIPVAEINGSTGASNSTIWTAAKGTAFAATYWRAFLCSPNADGTYNVDTVYEYNTAKSVTVSGNKILFAIHAAYTNYAYCQSIKVGDDLSLNGIYIDNGTVSSKAHILVNGGVALVSDITPKTGSGLSVCGNNNNMFRGFSPNSTASGIKAKFNEDGQYLVIKNASGTTLANDSYVGTGCKVELVVGGVVKKSYQIVVAGDVNGDASISSADYIEQTRAAKSLSSVTGAYETALDYNGDGGFSSADVIALALQISGK